MCPEEKVSMFVLSSFTASTGLFKGCISSNMCSLSLMTTFVPSATKDGISCGRAKNIAASTTSVLNIIFPNKTSGGK